MPPGRVFYTKADEEITRKISESLSTKSWKSLVIFNQISLQGFARCVDKKSSNPEVLMADEKVSVEDMSDDDLDQIIQDIAKEEEEPVVAVKPEVASTPTLGILAGKKAAQTSKPEQSLNLELTGVINLKLNFSSGERSIEVLCTEEALICRMADGTEFRIPTGMEKKRKAA